MTFTQKSSIALVITAVLFCIALALASNINLAGASAPAGLKTTIATTSPAAVTGTASMLFATSTCDARIITTAGSSIMLTFSDYAGQTPSATFGHIQATSTTVVYDSGQYGCGAVKAFSFANQLLTVSESR
jgi:hypothetical protein